MARLVLSTPDGQRTVELRAKNTLGRHPDNSIQLLDKIVSKEHCIIELRGQQFILRDLGSLNGTYVDGQRVNGEVLLSEGAEIAMGQTTALLEQSDRLPTAPHAAGWEHPTAAMTPGYSAPPGLTPTSGASAAPGLSVSKRLVQSPGGTQIGFGQAPSALAAGGSAAQAAQRTPPPPGGVPVSLGQPASSSRRIGMKTRVDLSDQARAIGTQIDATQKGFLPFDQVARDQVQLSQDYERLRLSHELAREIALERDLEVLLDKILATIFRFVRADRGVILLKGEGGLAPAASHRRDGTDRPIPVSSTIMAHVMVQRATVLTHDAAMDFAASKGKSMILNNISSAIVAPLLHDDEILGVLWLDSETLAQFQHKDLEIVTAIANQAAMFIEINILGKKIEQEVVNRERFSRLLSPNVAQKVLSGELEVRKGGRLVDSCTVFNSDIRGFTAMSERASPEEIVDMLNEYFERMVETIFKYEGTLDKFMGDGIMALWGAPVVHPDDAIRAVNCALEHIDVLEQFNKERAEANKGRLEI